jgi:hypothetical protein
MRPGKVFTAALVVGLMGAGTVLAAEIVHFTNGTYMEISSHTVKDGMIEVVFSNDAKISFPASVVERIEKGGRSVYPGLVGGTARNQAVPGSTSSGGPPEIRTERVTGEMTAPRRRTPSASARRRQLQGMDPADQLRYSAAAPAAPDPLKPFPNHATPAKRKVSVVGNTALQRGGAQAQNDGGSPTLSDGDGVPGKDFTPIRLQPSGGPGTARGAGQVQRPGTIPPDQSGGGGTSGGEPSGGDASGGGGSGDSSGSGEGN